MLQKWWLELKHEQHPRKSGMTYEWDVQPVWWLSGTYQQINNVWCRHWTNSGKGWGSSHSNIPDFSWEKLCSVEVGNGKGHRDKELSNHGNSNRQPNHVWNLHIIICIILIRTIFYFLDGQCQGKVVSVNYFWPKTVYLQVLEDPLKGKWWQQDHRQCHHQWKFHSSISHVPKLPKEEGWPQQQEPCKIFFNIIIDFCYFFLVWFLTSTSPEIKPEIYLFPPKFLVLKLSP